MGSIGRIISSTSSGAFVLVLMGLIGVIWFTPARDLDITAIPAGYVQERIDVRHPASFGGPWMPSGAITAPIAIPSQDTPVYSPSTHAKRGQPSEKFTTVETVRGWPTHLSITRTEGVGAGNAGNQGPDYKLFGFSFLLTILVFLAAFVNLRLFRFDRMQKLVLSGIAASFLLYVLSIVTEGLSKAELMYPAAAECLPVLVGGFTGLITLLHREDG